MSYIYHVTLEHVLSGTIQSYRFTHHADALSFINNHLIGYIHQLVRVEVYPDGQIKPYNKAIYNYCVV